MSSAESLPVPPWSAARRERERPAAASAKAPLTRDAIVDAAIVVLDAEGLDGVSMRRVAQRLETGPASLYQHVGNKDELLELVLDRVSADVEIPAPGVGPDGWQEPLKELLRRVRKVLGAHQDLAYVMLGRVPTGPNALAGAEGMLRILREGGIPDRLAAHAVDSLALFVASVTYEDAIRRRLIGTVEESKEYVERVREYFLALPKDRFPTLVAMADTLTTFDGDEDEGFEFALDIQIRGIAALAAEQS
ncbi:MAG TPA: TetR/AcrR family transcriptional regulator [Baekduia sp.]|nr:TetR/AcrR family transcriptional regulator [Baekduia sp.]